MDLGYDLLTNKKKIKLKKQDNIIKNEEELYNHIKDEIIKLEKIEDGPFIKLSELQLLKIIKISINEYKSFTEKNNQFNKDQNNKLINGMKKIINKNDNSTIENKDKNIKNIKIVSSKKNYEINNLKLNL